MNNNPQPTPPPSYQTLLVRRWHFPADRKTRRFVVETVSGHPQRWRFNTFAELAAFLQATLLNDERIKEE
jgi:hypothetical protein